MTPEKLKEILADHVKWARNDGGSRANLTGANLRGAKINGGIYTARSAVQFSAHGECGRELSAIKTDAKENPITLYCGCFAGTPDELREYIAKGEDKYKQSRTLAMEMVLMLLNQESGKP